MKDSSGPSASDPLGAAEISLRTLPIVTWDRLELESDQVVSVFSGVNKVGRVHLVRVGDGWDVQRIQWCADGQPPAGNGELATPIEPLPSRIGGDPKADPALRANGGTGRVKEHTS